MDIRGKLVLVTGASRGIGAATARAMAQAGAKGVILLARTESDLQKVASELEALGSKGHVYALNLAEAEAVGEAAKRIKAEVGIPDIIVNNAGLGRWLFIEDTPPEEGLFMMAVPWSAAFLVTQAFAGDMLRRNSGHIVIVNSPVSRVVWPGAITYSSARWALRGFSESLKSSLHGTGIGVTEVVAGKTTSSYFEANEGAEAHLPGIAKLIPIISPEYVANKIVSGVKNNRRLMVFPFMLWLFNSLNQYFPRLVRAIVRATGAKRK